MLSSMQTNHRLWPLPKSPWIMSQVWHELLFAHWALPVEVIQPFIPSGLKLDTFDGKAWLAVVPFRMSGVRPRCVPSVPGLSAFLELNVRTYVTLDNKPGVLFLSLDAANNIAVKAARMLYLLPYFWANMTMTQDHKGFHYHSHRREPGIAAAELKADYHPISPIELAQPGSLEHWLTERYCLYSYDPQGNLYRCEIHHDPWPLQRATAEFEINTMAEVHGIKLKGAPQQLHYARKLEVVVWPLQRLN